MERRTKREISSYFQFFIIEADAENGIYTKVINEEKLNTSAGRHEKGMAERGFNGQCMRWSMHVPATYAIGVDMGCHTATIQVAKWLKREDIFPHCFFIFSRILLYTRARNFRISGSRNGIGVKKFFRDRIPRD